MAAYITDAKEGYIYIRAEYKYLFTKLKIAINRMEASIKTLGVNFKIELIFGAGAYVCGEETALLQSMKGRRGEPANNTLFCKLWIPWKTNCSK